MSFDIQFVQRPTTTWDPTRSSLGDYVEREPTPVDTALWERLSAAVASEVPDAELFESLTVRELSDHATGIQISLLSDDIFMSAAYWFEGEEAEAVDSKLKRLAASIEAATGLASYSPQDNNGFLESWTAEPPMSASAEMSRVRQFMSKVGLTGS